MTLKPIGFLQEDFHSEVLDFLLELITNREPTRQIILYNRHDRYNNKDTYKQKYLNFTVRGLNNYIHDMVNNVCEKIIVVSYDNIFHIDLLEPYKDRLIFIAHSQDHVKLFNYLNMESFALTNLVSRNYMIPFVKDISFKIKDKVNKDKVNKDKVNKDHVNKDHVNKDHVNKDKVNKDDHIQKMLNFIKQRKAQENLDIITIVGNFLENNKDTEILDHLASSKQFIILIYAPEMSELLNSYITRHNQFAYAALRISTKEIQSNMEFLDSKYILFSPPKESKCYISSWSGSIAFAFDNDFHLIMPKLIADYYCLNKGHLNKGSVISYTNKDDIISQIKSNSGFEYKQAMQQIRENTYERNCRIWDIICDKNTSKFNGFKINHCNNIEEYIDLYKKIFNSIPTIKDRLNNKTIIDIDSNTTIFDIVCFSISPNCKLINFIKDLQAAKYYKKLMTYNNLLDNTTIYNNTVGKICKQGTLNAERVNGSGTLNAERVNGSGTLNAERVNGSGTLSADGQGTPDMFSLDSLNLQDISLIHMNSNQANDIIIGANNLIKTQTPILLIKHDEKINEQLNLNHLGYTHMQHENYSVYY